ncbi:MAG: UDP-N-acetylglucosamine 2-epimerase (non-hydrolyzing) [Candidatus Omnitrophica bacterium]|nr:UDP-N-acetylglucosamine 2-epimerase (non-hydrolyzing) [Candidatus Omnitrophota bacterium]
MKNKKLAFIFGTRPEIIKLSPIIRECQRKKVSFFCIHTGQHYSYALDTIFFKELRLPKPEYRLQIKSKAPFRQGEHTGTMLIEIEKILLREMPYCVVVQGDTNTVLAAALTAEKISTTSHYTGFYIKVAHVEAGLRSFDRSMPEEVNRFIADHLSDFLFVPTKNEQKLLLREGVPSSWIHVTGNTIVDALQQSLALARRVNGILGKLAISKNAYMLLTLHRQENVDSKIVFKNILKGLESVYEKFRLPVIFPMHPRTQKRLKVFNLKIPFGIKVIEPVGFLDFLSLEADSRLTLTDSGGVQEESCILKVPCVTLRNNTERPQTVLVDANVVAGTNPENILKAAIKMYGTSRRWRNPLGDGTAAKQILNILLK